MFFAGFLPRIEYHIRYLHRWRSPAGDGHTYCGRWISDLPQDGSVVVLHDDDDGYSEMCGECRIAAARCSPFRPGEPRGPGVRRGV